MPEFEAQIKAGKLKHVANVLRRADDEAIFEINNQGMTCKLIDTTNSLLVQVTLPRAVFDLYDADDVRAGIDLDKLAGNILKRATAKDIINISGDESMWYVTRGIHQKSMGLLDPARLRNAPKTPCLLNTANMRFTGKEFKEIVAEASDTDAQIAIHASQAGLLIKAISIDKTPDTYRCALPSERFEIFSCYEDASSSYPLDHLQDIAADMRASDDVLFQFSNDTPCTIKYERGGLVVWFMVAPRIEND